MASKAGQSHYRHTDHAYKMNKIPSKLLDFNHFQNITTSIIRV